MVCAMVPNQDANQQHHKSTTIPTLGRIRLDAVVVTGTVEAGATVAVTVTYIMRIVLLVNAGPRN